MNSYARFLERKTQAGDMGGFKPLWMPDWLRGFQQNLTETACLMGRMAMLADCGLGKTPMQLVWSENVVRHTNGNVLIAAPLAVSHQTIREGEKFGIEVKRSTDGKPAGKITITNYERLHHFNSADFTGFVGDESSCIKHFEAKRRAVITEFLRTMPYRLLCTATAAPNDYFELGTSSEALGYLGYTDMLTRFFKQETKKDYLGWGRTKYIFRGHAEQPFWRWVCSWARVCRKPSDLGFPDDEFVLPELREHEIISEVKVARPGMLFPIPARGMSEEREESRISLNERCETAADIASRNGTAVLWCHLNDEGDLLEKVVPDAVQVSGSMSDEKKEERLIAFQAGQIKRLVIKPKIGCFGLNWQHCHNVITFVSHSFEQYYQAVRRCWRFGQVNPVDVHIIATEGQVGALKNLQRKCGQADRMFSALTRYANDALHVDRTREFPITETLPEWLAR